MGFYNGSTIRVKGNIEVQGVGEMGAWLSRKAWQALNTGQGSMVRESRLELGDLIF